MEIYNSEQEQVEALRKWWRENGTALILGVVLGLGGLFGYRGWVDYRDGQAEQAADVYQQALVAARAGDLAGVRAAREQLLADYASTPYPVLAALLEAKGLLEAGDAAAARTQLQWVVEQAPTPELADVARLRLASLALAERQPDAALAALESLQQGGSYRAQVAELRGDAALLRGDQAAARTAYQEALAAGGENRAVVRMKLDDLGGPEVAPQALEEKP
ncbi:MAG TPA: tetratricopeptide repeat protein [Gammaproteobacteria bacterium]